MPQVLQVLEHPHMNMATLAASTVLRLTISAILGGVIGLERELKNKPAGLRTNMFICFGAAMFTILSNELAGEYTGDHTRIAAQIIPGIGFIGAGSILHSRGSVSGLTSAATMFVVASIGMAVGGGLYVPAIFATLIMFIALQFLGYMERSFKASLVSYQVQGQNITALVGEVNRILEDEEKKMESVRIDERGDMPRLRFAVYGTRKEQAEMFRQLRTSNITAGAERLGDEREE